MLVLRHWSRATRRFATIHLNLQCPLNLSDVSAFVACMEGRCHTARSSAARAACPVNEIFRHLRQVEVHHMRDVVDMDAARRDIGRHKNPVGAILKALQCLIALTLRTIAMDAGRVMAEASEMLGKAVRTMLGACENQKCARFVTQQSGQKFELAILVHFVNVQIDVFRRFGGNTDRDARRILHVRSHQMRDALLDGRGKQQGLAGFGQILQDQLNGRKKAHVQHAVRFIEHHRLHASEVNQATLQKVTQAARCRDHNLRTVANLAQLPGFVHAAHHNRRPDRGSDGQLHHSFIDLDRQFAGWAEHHRANLARSGLVHVGQHPLDHRDRECQGLSSSSLRRGHYILAGESRGNRLRLHRRGGDEAMLRQIALQYRAQSQIRKFVHSVVSFNREQRPACVLLFIGNTCRSRSSLKRKSRVFSVRRSSCLVRL